MRKGFGNLWGSLTSPAKVIADAEERRRAQLTAGFMLVLTPLIIAYYLKGCVIAPAADASRVDAESTLFLGAIAMCKGLYILSRTRYAAWASRLLIAAFVGQLAAVIALVPDEYAFRTTAPFLSLAVLMSTLLLPLRHAVAVALTGYLWLGGAALYIRPGPRALSDISSFYSISCALIAVTNWQRRKDLAAVRTEKAFSDRILDASPDFVFVKGKDRRYIRVNAAYARLVGQPAAAIVGKNDLELGFGDDVVFGNAALGVEGIWQSDDAIIGGAPVHVTPLRRMHIQGADVLVHSLRVPIAEGDGTAVLGIARDVTKLHAVELQLEAERQVAQRALDRREQLLRVVPAGIFETNEHGAWTWVNERMAALCGLAPRDCVGTGWQRALHPDDEADFVRLWSAAVASRAGLDVEFRLIAAGGASCWVHLKASAAMEDGKAWFLGVVHDISEAKRKDQELRESGNFLRSIIDNLPMGLFVRDALDDFKFTVVNKQGSKLFGFRDENLGVSDRLVTEPELLAVRRQRDLQILATGEVMDIAEERLELGDRTRIVHTIKAPIAGVDGKRRYLLGLVEDITDRVEARREIDLYHRVASEMSLCLWVLSLEAADDPRSFRVIVANRAASDYFGYDTREMIGRRVADLPGEPEQVPWELYHRLARHGGAEDLGRVQRLVRGVERTYFVRAFGLDRGMVGVLFDDVSERVATEKALEKERVRVIESAKLASLGELSGGIAHEINNPLTVVLGKARIARMTLPADSAEARLLEGIERSAGRIATIIKGLRSFTRDGTKDPFVREPLAAIIDDTLALTRERILAHGIELRAQHGVSELPIECRATQIVQILVNLLSNAHDAVEGKPGAWIEIGAKRSGEEVEITIANSGPAIPAWVQQRMFRPFFTTKEVGRGTGLGLSISLGLARDHGGNLEYDGESPHPRFVLRLPVSQAEAGHEAA